MKLHNTNHGIKLFVSAEIRTRDLSDHSRGDLPLSHEAFEKRLLKQRENSIIVSSVIHYMEIVQFERPAFLLYCLFIYKCLFSVPEYSKAISFLFNIMVFSAAGLPEDLAYQSQYYFLLLQDGDTVLP